MEQRKATEDWLNLQTEECMRRVASLSFDEASWSRAFECGKEVRRVPSNAFQPEPMMENAVYAAVGESKKDGVVMKGGEMLAWMLGEGHHWIQTFLPVIWKISHLDVLLTCRPRTLNT